MSGDRWLTRRRGQGDVHVLPIRDLREHAESRRCWCGPEIQCDVSPAVVVHHSEDGRELVEQHGLQ